MKKLYFFMILMFFQAGVFAQGNEQERYQVHYKSGQYFPEKHFQLEKSGKKGNKGSRRGGANSYVLIQFYQLPDKALHQKVKAAGIELLEYIPNNAYLASLSGAPDAALLSELGVRSLEAVQPEHKLDPALLRAELAEWVEKEGGKADLVVTAFKGYALTVLTNEVVAFGGEVLKAHAGHQMLEVRLPKGQISGLAALSGVAYIAPVAPPPVPLNYYSVTTGRVNILRSGLSASPKLLGEGVTIAVGDIFSGKIHADLQNRVSNLATYNSNDPHGDHTSGTIAGAGNLNPLHAGIAPKASLIYTDMVENINNAPYFYLNRQLRITSNSYRGSLNGGEYNFNSRVIDQQTSGGQYPDLLHVFAAANEGSGFRTVADSWSAAKNSLVVGALDHKSQIAFFSSRGPVKDGRIKPEVVAVGLNVTSTVPENNYSSMSGTSMSTPAVAGIASLLYERYKQLNNNANPDAALIKALICNTADDLGNPGPDFTYGFGQVNARRAVEVLEKGNWFKSSVNAGDSITHTVNIPAGTARLKVMLYWNDKAAAENSAVALVNDLDMRVKRGGVTFLPWVLNTATGKENNLAVRGVDRLNNIEQVTIDNPSGTYSFTVNGKLLATGSQDYVVVYEVEEPEIVVTYPYAGESLVPGERVFIRWDHSLAGPFSVYYSSDNGSSWNSIAGNIAAKQKYVEWQVPNTVTGQLLVRVSNGTKSGQSAGVSTIMDVPQGFMAADLGGGQRQLRWRKVPGATAYEVYQLRASDKEMQLTGTVADTSFMMENISSNDIWYAVRAKNQQGAMSRRTNASRAVVFREGEDPTSVAAGWHYNYYEGSWSSMPDFTALSPVKSGVTEGIQHNTIKQRSDNYGIRYTGFLKVPEDGLYTFDVYARTEARFYVGNQLVAQHAIDRDGDGFGSGEIALKAGLHKVTYDFYERNAANPAEFAYLLITGGSFSRREVLSGELFRSLENQLPVVNISSPVENASFNAPAAISITAAASDSDGSISKVEFFSGNTKIGEDLSAPYSYSWSSVPAGTYILQAKATDDKGAVKSSVPVTIKVEEISAGNQVPVVFAGTDRTIYLPVNSVNLSGQARDYDGRFVAFRWEKVSGPSATMSGERTANVSISNLENGVYVFRFSATDNDGATGTDEMTLTVLGDAEPLPNQSPLVEAGPDRTIYLPKSSISMSGQAKDYDGRFVKFLWEKVSGPSLTMTGQNTANVSWSDLVEGVYVFRFSATDNGGATGTDEMTLTVKAAGSTAFTAAEEGGITAYPNTFQDFINVEIYGEEPGEYEISVFDLLGRTYYQGQLTSGSVGEVLTHRIELGDKNLQQGIYLIRVEQKNRKHQKVIKIVKRDR